MTSDVIENISRTEPPEEVVLATVRTKRRKLFIAPYLFVLPGILLLGVWVYWPLLQTIWLSFWNGNLTKGTTTFAGFQNYLTVLGLPEFQQSVINTLVYIVGLIPLTVVLPMFVAILLSRVRGFMQVLYRSILFIPVIMAPVVVSVIWLWILNPLQGVLNQTLKNLFGITNTNWLTDSSTAIWVIILITAWKVFGFSLILFLAAIVSINREYLEAARSDGASDWSLIRYVIFPLITPTFYFLIIYTALFAGQWVFGTVNVLTQGGPRNTTNSVHYIMYQFGFEFFNIGTASAAAVLLFIFFGIGTLFGVRFTDRKAHYES